MSAATSRRGAPAGEFAIRASYCATESPAKQSRPPHPAIIPLGPPFVTTKAARVRTHLVTASALRDICTMGEKPAAAVQSFESFRASSLKGGADEVLERHYAPGQVVETHTHPFDADALMTEGEMWLTCGGETRHLRAGDTFHLPNGTPHSEKYGPQGATYWVARRNAR